MRIERNSYAVTIGSILVALVWTVPYLWVLANAFLAEPVPGQDLPRLSLEAFRTVLRAAPFGRYFFNSLMLVVGIVLVQCVTATLAAYAFARLKFPFQNVLFMLLLVQIVIPNDILIVPNYQTLSRFGALNTLQGIMLPFFASAFGIFLLRQTFKSIPVDFEQSAEIDGCGLWGKLRYVYVPMSVPAYVSFILVSVSTHWNDFLWPMIVTSSDTVRPMTVGLAIFATSFETGAQWTEVSAATFLVTLPLVLLFIAFQRNFVDSFTFSSGLK
jgi:sn-glycerol 3-phosphate transport system permease protein